MKTILPFLLIFCSCQERTFKECDAIAYKPSEDNKTLMGCIVCYEKKGLGIPIVETRSENGCFKLETLMQIEDFKRDHRYEPTS